MITEKAREVVNEVSREVSEETGINAEPWLVAQRISIRLIEARIREEDLIAKVGYMEQQAVLG